jgi:hypothetical protein
MPNKQTRRTRHRLNSPQHKSFPDNIIFDPWQTDERDRLGCDLDAEMLHGSFGAVGLKVDSSPDETYLHILPVQACM